jgi:hypothetical protein
MSASLVNDENHNSYYNKRGRLDGSVIYDEGGSLVVYDTFIRRGKLYFVSTFHNSVHPNFRIKVEGCKVTEVALNEAEPVRYFVCDIGKDNKDNKKQFNIYVNGNIHMLEPTVVLPLAKRWRLAVATLFKFETVAMVERFLDYYRRQGVDMFYLYFNGPELPAGLVDDVDVCYRLWDFPYWNKPDFTYMHYAQSIFLTTIRLRHLDDCEWLALIDLDEFLYYDIEMGRSGRLLDYLETCKSYDVVRVRNHWSYCPDSGGPITFTVESGDWLDRTKCIYRRTFNGHFAIHGPKNIGNFKEFRALDLRLLHLTTLHPERKELIKGLILRTGLSLNKI